MFCDIIFITGGVCYCHAPVSGNSVYTILYRPSTIEWVGMITVVMNFNKI